MVRLQLSALNLLCVEVSLKTTCLVLQTRLEMSQGLFRNHTLLSLQAHVEMSPHTWLEMILKSLLKVPSGFRLTNVETNTDVNFWSQCR